MIKIFIFIFINANIISYEKYLKFNQRIILNNFFIHTFQENILVAVYYIINLTNTVFKNKKK